MLVRPFASAIVAFFDPCRVKCSVVRHCILFLFVHFLGILICRHVGYPLGKPFDKVTICSFLIIIFASSI